MPAIELLVEEVVKLIEQKKRGSIAKFLSNKLGYEELIAKVAIHKVVKKQLKATMAENVLFLINEALNDVLTLEVYKGKHKKHMITILDQLIQRNLTGKAGKIGEILCESSLIELMKDVGTGAKPLKIGLVGKTGTGKSSVLNYIADYPFSQAGNNVGGETSTNQIFQIPIPCKNKNSGLAYVSLIDTQGYADIRSDSKKVEAIISDYKKEFDIILLVTSETFNAFDKKIIGCGNKVIILRNKIDADSKLCVETMDEWESKWLEYKKTDDLGCRSLVPTSEIRDKLEIYHISCVRGEYTKGDIEKYKQLKGRHKHFNERNCIGEDDIWLLRDRLSQLDRDMRDLAISEGFKRCVLEKIFVNLEDKISQSMQDHLIAEINERFRGGEQSVNKVESCHLSILEKVKNQSNNGVMYLDYFKSQIREREEQFNELFRELRVCVLQDTIECIQNKLYDEFNKARDKNGDSGGDISIVCGALFECLDDLSADVRQTQVMHIAQESLDWLYTTRLKRSFTEKITNIMFISSEGSHKYEDKYILKIYDIASKVMDFLKSLKISEDKVDEIAILSFYVRMYKSVIKSYPEKPEENDSIKMIESLEVIMEQLSLFKSLLDDGGLSAIVADETANKNKKAKLLQISLSYFKGSMYARDCIANFFRVPFIGSIVDLISEKVDGDELERNIRSFIFNSKRELDAFRERDNNNSELLKLNESLGKLKSIISSIVHIEIGQVLSKDSSEEIRVQLEENLIQNFNDKVYNLLCNKDSVAKLKDYIEEELNVYIKELALSKNQDVVNEFKSLVVEEYKTRISQNPGAKLIVEGEGLVLEVEEHVYSTILEKVRQNLKMDIQKKERLHEPIKHEFLNARGGAEALVPALCSCGDESDKLAHHRLSKIKGNIIPQEHIEKFKELMKKREIGREEIVEYLKSIDIVSKEGLNMRCSVGGSLLHFAAECNCMIGAKTLIELGCEIEIADPEGITPLHVAAMNDSCEVMALLIEAGVNIDPLCSIGGDVKVTPLMYAVDKGHNRATSLLIQHRANVNKRFSRGETILHIAAKKYGVGMIEIILSGNPDINVESIEGYTPIMISIESNKVDVTQLLLKYFADISHRNSVSGRTIFEIAMERASAQHLMIIFNSDAAIAWNIYRPESLKKIELGLKTRFKGSTELDQLIKALRSHVDRAIRNAQEISTMFIKMGRSEMDEVRYGINTTEHEKVLHAIGNLTRSIVENLGQCGCQYPDLLISIFQHHKEKKDILSIGSILHIGCESRNSDLISKICSILLACEEKDKVIEILECKNYRNEISLRTAIHYDVDPLAISEILKVCRKLNAGIDLSCCDEAVQKCMESHPSTVNIVRDTLRLVDMQKQYSKSGGIINDTV